MLDGQQSDEQYMKQLYLRFLQGVKDNNNSEFYEMDELLDIYDYAQDEGDEMVQLYVLLTGARLYPDSDFLDERKAFFLSAVNEQAAKNMLSRNGRKDTALWGVLKLALDNLPDGNPEASLGELLASGLKFNCEAIIRLIDTLHDLNRDDLIAESFHLLEERALNPGLLYYEAAEVLYNNEDYVAMAHDLAEELTKQEPFNPDNWILLSKIEFTMEHVEESIAAADYALAIDPTNLNGRLVKGIAMVASGKNQKEAIELLRGILAENPENAIATKALAEAYIVDGKTNAALEVYYSFMSRDAANSYVILDILKLKPHQADRYLELFDKQVGNNEHRWIEVAAQLANSEFLEEATQMLAFFHSRYKLREGMEYFLILLYRVGLHEEYISLFEKICAEAKLPGAERYDLSANAYLLLAAAYLKTGKYNDAITMANLMLKDPPLSQDFDESIRWKGMQVVLQLIRNLASHPELVPDDPRFDPIMFEIRNASYDEESASAKKSGSKTTKRRSRSSSSDKQ